MNEKIDYYPRNAFQKKLEPMAWLGFKVGEPGDDDNNTSNDNKSLMIDNQTNHEDEYNDTDDHQHRDYDYCGTIFLFCYSIHLNQMELKVKADINEWRWS